MSRYDTCELVIQLPDNVIVSCKNKPPYDKSSRDWSSYGGSSDLHACRHDVPAGVRVHPAAHDRQRLLGVLLAELADLRERGLLDLAVDLGEVDSEAVIVLRLAVAVQQLGAPQAVAGDRKSTRLNSSH